MKLDIICLLYVMAAFVDVSGMPTISTVWNWLVDPDNAIGPLENEYQEYRTTGLSYCGDSVTQPTGECTHLGTCLAFGGSLSFISTCSYFPLKHCCVFTFGCGGVMKNNIGFWRSTNYPADATDNGLCVLTVKPAYDTCWIRIQFENTQLTAPTVNNCDSNTLTIYNQAEGDGSLICGSLVNYETLVRVKTTHFLLGPDKIFLMLNIRDATFRYNIKITRVTCAQISGVVSGRSSQESGRALDYDAESTDLNSIDDSSQRSEFTSHDLDELINADEELINNLLSFNSDFNNEILSGDIEDVVTEIINYNSTYLENSELSTTTEEFDYSSTEFSTTEDFSNEFAVTFASKPDEDYDEDDNDAEPPTIDVSSLTRLAEDDGLVSPNGLVRVVDLCSLAENDISQRIFVPDVAGAAKALAVGSLAPYFGQVMILNDVGQYHLCSTTLIHARYVLTAASCLLRRGYDTSMYEIRVYYDLTNVLKGKNKRTWSTMWARIPSFPVKRVIFHPMYEHNRFDYDIAVMELHGSVPSTNTPITLAAAGSGTYDDTAAIEVGMGARAILPSFLATNYIRKGVLQSGTILSNADCQTAYDAATPTQTIDSHHICVSLADEHQACEGDQGGPVVVGYPGSEVLVGIISGNQHNCIDYFDSGNLVAGTFPDIAVRITSVLDFINAATTEIRYTDTMLGFSLLSSFTNMFSLNIGR